MPNNEEKKYTVDDILEEYDNAMAEKKSHDEKALNEEIQNEEPVIEETPRENLPEEISDDDEINEEQEFVSEEHSSEYGYKKTELFDEFSTGNSEEAEDASDECEEEIFMADDDDDDVEIAEEILEIDRSEAENADIILESEDTFEKMVENALLEESSLWKDNIDTVEMTEKDAAEFVQIPEETPEKTETEAEQKEETAGTEEKTASVTENQRESTVVENSVEEEIPEEDVNDKFIKRFLKGILPWKGDSVGEIIRKIIFLVAVIVFIGAGVMLVSTLMQSGEAVEDKKLNQSIITTTVATAIDSDGNIVTVAPTEEEIAEHNFNVAEHFKSINEDYIGYLEVEGCDIYEPIMQGDDNDYYLDHNYYGGTNKAGTVFLDYRCKVREDYISPNIVFYGHNQEDGTMFGNLKDYKQNVEFYQENPLIKFSPEFETGEYVIYGYFVTHVRPEQHSSGIVFHYHDYIETLNDEETFNWYIDEVQKRNQIVSPVDVQYGDKLLCLSTCSNEFSDSRFVVFARRLREGETIDDFDFSETYLNYNAEGVDWEAIMSNETTLTEETEETEESEEIEENSETEETEATEETTVAEENENVTTTKKKKYKSYAEIMKEKKTATKTEATETSATEENESEAVSDGEESAETSAPGETEEAVETTVPPESVASEETTVTP